MQSRIMTTVLALIALGCLSACQQKEVAPDTTADVAAIKAQTLIWVDAYNRRDAAALANVYYEEAVHMPPARPALEGKAAIAEAFKTVLETETRQVSVTAPEIEVLGDRAYVRGSFAVTGADGNKVDAGKYLGIWRKEHGIWHIYRHIYNSDAPPAAPADAAKPADGAAKKK